MDLSDHDQNDPYNGATASDHEPTHAHGPLGEGWLRSVVEHSSEIVTVVDPDGTLRYANPAWGRAMGYDPEQAVGTMNVLDHVHPDDLAHVLEETAEALAKRGVVTNEAEYRFRRKDGSWLWMQSVGTYLLDDPAVGGVVVASRDVTERKEAEEALRASEAEVFSVLESITDGFFSLDQEMRFAYVNSQAEVLLGRSREDLVGEMIWGDPTFYPQYLRALAEGKTVAFEGYYPPLEAWYGVRAYPSASGLSVYFQDITERKKAEERLRFQAQLLGAVGEAVIALDTEGRVLYWNRAAAEMYGWSSEEIMGRRLRDMVVPEDLRGRAEEIAGQLRAGRSWAGEFEVRRRDGTTFSVEGTDTPIFGEDGHLVGVIGVLKDITERQGFEERLREAEVRYRTLVEHIPAVTYIDRIDDVSSAIYVSPQVEGMLGYTPEEWLEDPEFWPKILHPHDKERVLAEARRTDETGDPFSVEYRAISKDGLVVWVRDEAVLVRGGRDTPLFWQGVLHDVTERKALEEHLRHLALRDSLTDLPNRRLFVDRLGQALGRTSRRDRLVAVLFMDLDDFKGVNDSLGHETGDLLLVAVAERLKGCLRLEDTLARFGGDEFVVLLGDMEVPDEAVRVAERIAEGFGSPFLVEGRELYVRASIGIAVGDTRNRTPEDLLRAADTAMYRAKEEGSGHYSMFDPAMYERAVGRLEMENGLRRAIEHEEFVVHYQPIVSLDDGAVWGVEALLRWEHPERGLLNPGEFVPVAEKSGLVVPMGEGMLMEACREAKGWQEEHPHAPPLVMSVNLSAKQLGRHDLAKVVEGMLQETGLEAHCLSLDVTETVYARALEGNTASLERLREIGVGISIDDFGTGYSSLAYLKSLPADALKVDKSFVRGLGVDTEDTAIVRMTLDLAHSLGMKTIAEGVETEEQETILREMGCDMAQGYHFSRPLPPAAVSEFLAN